MAAPKRIRSGDADYDDIHEDWVANGRPYEFDRQGAFGGALYHCLDRDEEEPDFYQVASKGPTTLSERGRVVQEGWHLINKTGGLEFREDPETGVPKPKWTPYDNEL